MFQCSKKVLDKCPNGVYNGYKRTHKGCKTTRKEVKMLNTNSVSDEERKEIVEIARMLEKVPKEQRSMVKGFLIGAESTEQTLRETKATV